MANPAPIHLGSQFADATAKYRLTVRSAVIGGSLAGYFTGDETFLAVLHPGEGRAAVATLDATWDPDPALGDNPTGLAEPAVRLTITKAALAGLTDYGRYYGRVMLDPDLYDVDLWSAGFMIDIMPPIDAAVVLRTYCSRDDVRDLLSWVERSFPAVQTHQIDLAEQRNLAALWTERCIRSRARHWFGEWQRHSTRPDGLWISEAFQETVTEALADSTISDRVEHLVGLVQAAIEADGLVVTDDVRRCNAERTCYHALAPYRFHGDQGERLGREANGFAAAAEATRRGTVFELDMDDDGVVDLKLG